MFLFFLKYNLIIIFLIKRKQVYSKFFKKYTKKILYFFKIIFLESISHLVFVSNWNFRSFITLLKSETFLNFKAEK